MDDFWELAAAGARDAMQGGANEPFGLWPLPPLPRHTPTAGLPYFKFD
jgi:hypothetical protein